MSYNLKLLQLLNTKIFHDFAGPLSAISNGVDYLLSGKSEMQVMANNIIDESSRKAINLLQFYRYIYGMLNLNGEANLEEIKNINSEFLDNKIQLNIDERISHVPKIFISILKSRIAMGILVCAKSNLLNGGIINLSIHSIANQNFIKILALGNKLKVDQNKITILTADAKNLNLDSATAQDIHEYYIHALLQESDTKLSIQADETSIEYKFDL